MSMGPSLASMAWRNIWRNRRRTLITLFGIAFGLFLSVLFTGLGDSSYADMIDYGSRMGGGHVAVQHEEFLDSPSLKHTVPNAEELVERFDARPDTTIVVPRIAGAGMLATASNSVGTFFLAIDPSRETQESIMFTEHIREGEMFASDDARGIVIGKTIAENLDVEVGKKIVLTVTDSQGEIVTALVRVRGIVETGADSVDGSLCLLPISAMRDLLSYGQAEATQVAVFLEDHRDSASVARELAEQLDTPSTALSWEQHQPDLAGYVQLERSSTWVMEFIIMALLTAGIFNTLFVSVMERLREFGILSAIGFSSRQLFGLVMWESLWLALMGLVMAAALTAWPYHHLNTQGFDYTALMPEGMEVAGVAILEPRLYVGIYLEHLLQLCLLVVVATMTAGLYPAWRAGRVPPADAIRLS